MSYIFGGNTGETQASVQRKRELASALAARNLARPPRDIGSGLNSIAQALMYRKMMGDADAGETAGRAKSAEAFGPLAALLQGGGASSGNQQSAPTGYDQAVTTGGNGMQDIAPANPVQAALNRPGAQPQIAPATGSKQIYDRVPQPGQQPAAQHNTLLPPEALAAAGMAQGQPQQPPQVPQQVAQAQQQPVPQDAMDNISLGQAYTAMNAEWLTPAQQSFAANVMKMKLQRMDPKYRMELMKIEQDIKAGNPEAKVALQRKLGEVDEEFKKAAEGREQDSPKYQGDLSLTDARTRKLEADIAKGEREIEAEQQAATTKTESRNRSADVVVQDIDRALTTLDEGSLPTSGAIGGALSNVPGTRAYNAGQLIQTVVANTGFDRLQQMRDSSTTGGALGAINKSEMELLQAALGNLKQSQDEPQLKDNLNRVRNIYLDIVHGPNGGPKRRELSFDKPSQGGGQSGWKVEVIE